jgi:SAM-dependent methyltransferase
MLPADEEEKMRIENEHNIFKMMRGGKNYVGPVRQALRPTAEMPNKACLDLGCGTALWLRDMSQEFPWVTFVGVDLLPIQAAPLPPNCRVEVDDFNNDLSHFYNQFDLVHGRIISAGVSDYRRLINECWQILRPGGMILLQDYPYYVCDANRQPINIPLPEGYSSPSLPPTRNEPGFVYTAFWIWILQRAFVSKNGRVDQAPWLEIWLSEHGGWEEVQSKDAWMPIGPWYEPAATAHEWGQNYLGELKRRDILALFSSTRQLILSYGLSLSDWEELEENVVRECTNSEQTRMVSRLTAVWARKKDPNTFDSGQVGLR